MKNFVGIILLVIFLAVGSGLILNIKPSQVVQTSDAFLINTHAIEELKVLDARWSLIAFASLDNPDTSFDKLADFLPTIRKLRNTLKISDLQSSTAPDALKNQLHRFLLLIESKEDLIEQFKSNFAIMRNSLKYFPLASQTLTSKMRNMENDNDTTIDEISSLYERTTAFLQNPSEGAKIRLLIDINRTNEKVMSYPQDISIPLGNYISHARVLVEKKIQLNGILEKLLASKVNDAGDELLFIYNAMHQKQLARQQSETNTTISISLVLAVIITLAGLTSAFLLWRKDRLFEQKLASGIAEKTEQFENLKASSSKPIVDNNIGRNLEVMGRMAATLAHEINTPLGYLDGNLQVLHNGMKRVITLFSEFTIFKQEVSNLRDTDAVKNYLESFDMLVQSTQDEAMLGELPDITEDMQEGIKQIQHVVSELKDFTRKDRSNKDWIDLKKCIQSALKMAGTEIPHTTKVELSLEETPRVYGAPAEINQALINLIVNASHAIIDAERHKSFIKISTRHEKNRIIVSVMDNGTGIDEKVKNNIFDPFFTTKEAGNGTGLGLAIVRRIIMDHNGRVHVNSIPGKGSNFIILLPAHQTADNPH
jgi:signal transduction histidine kinase